MMDLWLWIASTIPNLDKVGGTLMTKTILRLAGMTLVLAGGIQAAFAGTTVDATDKFSWAPNLGWVNWRGDVDHGAVFNESVASGFIYSANAGWINLGDGIPEDGVRYSNHSATDFGVNVDGESDPNAFLLSGYAYAANFGWINFGVAGVTSPQGRPRIEKATGILRGYAWSANTGWLTLDSPSVAIVRTGLTSEPTPTPTHSATPTVTPTQIPTHTPTPLPTPTPTSTPRTADLNGDGKVDAKDLLLLEKQWDP